MLNQEETSLAKEVLPSCLCRIQEVVGRDRVGWFSRLLSETEWIEKFQCFVYKYSNWDIHRIMMDAFGINLSPWIIRAWREAALRPKPTLLPEFQRYQEQPLALIVRPEQSSEEKKEPQAASGALSRR